MSHIKPARLNVRTGRGGYDKSSLEDDYQAEEYVTGNLEEMSLSAVIIPFYSRPVGKPHMGLRKIKSANQHFDKLMSYWSYRLIIT